MSGNRPPFDQPSVSSVRQFCYYEYLSNPGASLESVHRANCREQNPMIETKDWVMLVAMFGAMLVSIVWPQAGVLFSPYTMVLMMVLLFLSFLTIPMESILRTARSSALRLCGWIFLKLVILPVGVFGLTQTIYPEYALTALLLGGVSSGVVSPFFSTLLKANTALVITMVTASSILVPFTLPVLVGMLAGQSLVISLPAMIRLLAQVIFLPMIVAELLRLVSSRTAEKISRHHYVLSVVLCVAIILGVVSRYSDFFYHKPSVILEAVLIAVVLAVLSFGTGAMASIRQPAADRVAIILSFGLINNILVVVFSSEFFGPMESLVAMVYIVPFFCSIVFLRAYAGWSLKGSGRE
jgi:bile acid:Na+ symporter, BASS family